jgi:hypothetical protein
MIENTVTKTTQSATVVLNNRPAINAFASIESDGKYNFNFNVTDSEAYFANEIEAAKDITTFLTTVRKAAKAQRAVWEASQPKDPEVPEDGELMLNPVLEEGE